jgi:hypothetical protein
MIYRIFKTWILFAFLAAAMCGLVYLAVQQSLRIGANDPQIENAEDAAMMLGNGVPIASVVPAGSIDIASNLGTYMVLFDASGNPISGDARLDGAMPNLPPGVFAYTKTHGEDRFTWQPRRGVRSAVVVVSVANSSSASFVMAGRSLREIEIRETQAFREAAAAWFVTVIGILIIQLFFAACDGERRKAR